MRSYAYNTIAVLLAICSVKAAAAFPAWSKSWTDKGFSSERLPAGFPEGYPNSPDKTYYPPDAECTEYEVPIHLESDDYVFNATQWETDYNLEDFLSTVTTRPSAMFPSPFSGPVRNTGNYTIAASFCTPKVKNGKEKTVILATHGIGPARAHWNSAYRPEEYNFVQWATGQGYSVFFYDRLGVGGSSKISGYDAQISKSIAVVQELSSIIKSGQYTGSIGKPNKLAVMGFSYGSYTTHGAIALKPDIADAVILTGIGLNMTGVNGNGLIRSFVPRIAAQQNPNAFGEFDTGYLTWVDKYAFIENYFKAPFYDVPTIEYAEAVKVPFGISEFLTFDMGPMDAGNFTGPALAITGENDYIVCDGYCPGIFEEPARYYYRNAKFTPYIHPGASHDINFHHNATGAYKVITDFLAENGL